ncbi:alpha/beta fold hydrolase [Candidatus Mycobacterium methanotrophicum]|uniref:Alpha/beta hydrolase n=1 Tax=Candidatus Mycobacterium methanotrophicum TaxID=2943498 RepID=A0ABY4QLB2_9MYCO|nr:alpha/beta hydrolase [Candidatus Mycobacterium methanotrophicum]UQX11654.1 alpha/beta hydrolase [Candidatus Mycobacterium methanotrophicum]
MIHHWGGAESGTTVLSVRGVRIAASITGSGDPVLLLNGLSRPMQSWTPFLEAFPGRTVISYDSPGVGASQTPLIPFSMPMLADVAVRVLDEFGVGAADVVGFSFGGAVAQQLALGHPGRVNRLVLLASACGVGAVPGVPRIGLLCRQWKPAPKWLGLLWQIAAISSWTSIPGLGRIKAPTLVLCGDADKPVPPANSRVLASRISDARLITVRGGHDLQKPGPAAVVARLVGEFLDRPAPAAAS